MVKTAVVVLRVSKSVVTLPFVLLVIWLPLPSVWGPPVPPLPIAGTIFSPFVKVTVAVGERDSPTCTTEDRKRVMHIKVSEIDDVGHPAKTSEWRSACCGPSREGECSVDGNYENCGQSAFHALLHWIPPLFPLNSCKTHG